MDSEADLFRAVIAENFVLLPRFIFAPPPILKVVLKILHRNRVFADFRLKTRMENCENELSHQ